jgi:hypothetical protein
MGRGLRYEENAIAPGLDQVVGVHLPPEAATDPDTSQQREEGAGALQELPHGGRDAGAGQVQAGFHVNHP